jgi:DtxR family transcriptional regulator, Mn-dependent transcriptional regulator
VPGRHLARGEDGAGDDERQRKKYFGLDHASFPVLTNTPRLSLSYQIYFIDLGQIKSLLHRILYNQPMLASSTVENYLKAIYLSQLGAPDERLMPMGQLASSLGVTPGTATTMVKALSESGLVEYEPYIGVRLTTAGEKLAATVLRRHRLIELFLVDVMGMSWAEVHDEAENLEHAVSDRLVERMDEMLGRPEVDPHGDPIPNPEGTIPHRELQTLLTCPIETPMRVSRVTDQDPAFLRFIEDHALKPGQLIEVEARDPIADNVRVKGQGDRRITIGMRAASKLLVQLAVVLLVVVRWSGAVDAQAPAAAPEKFQIVDNSFLVEEAFNQEARVFQNIFTYTRRGAGSWDSTFTQEWPLGGVRQQLSFTLPVAAVEDRAGVGDLLINYRLQVWMEADRRPAFAPRISVILPTGDAARSLGTGSAGLQVNLPFSKQQRDLYFHWNGGFTWIPAPDRGSGSVEPAIAGSAIWRAAPMLNPMLEVVGAFPEEASRRVREVTVSPGVRWGINVGDRQLVFGAAVPVTFSSATERSKAGLLYASYELPFAR